MKKLLPLGTASLFVLLLVGSAQRSAYAALQESDLKGRVAELEEALAAQKKETDAVRSSLQAIQKYLETQAKNARELTAALDRAEEQGFTKGINFESRVTLLDGWRAALRATQKDLPKGAAPAAGSEGSRTRKPGRERR